MKEFRARSKVRRATILAAGAIIFLVAGCDPHWITSVNGLVGESDHAEPFDAKFVGDWYDPGWERLEWKIDRLVGTERYFLTLFGVKGEKEFYTGAVVKFGSLMLLDLQPTSSKGGQPRSHLIMKIERGQRLEVVFGSPRSVPSKKLVAFGGGPLVRNRILKLRPLQKRYILDHPQLVSSEKTVDGEGKIVSVTVTATTGELRGFFEAHGADTGLWGEDQQAVTLEAKMP